MPASMTFTLWSNDVPFHNAATHMILSEGQRIELYTDDPQTGMYLYITQNRFSFTDVTGVKLYECPYVISGTPHRMAFPVAKKGAKASQYVLEYYVKGLL